MRDRSPLATILAVLVALAAVAAWRVWSERPEPGRLELTGNVVSDVRVVCVPAIAVPSARAATGTSQPAASVRASRVAGMLAAVLVAEGDRVTTGQVVAQLDPTLLRLDVARARAVAAEARAEVDVIGGKLDTLAGKRADLADARRKLADARARLTAARAGLVAQIAQVEAMLRAPLPPGPLPPGRDPRVLLAKLKAALAQVDAGLAKTASGGARLDAGESRLAEARARATDARDVLALVAAAKDVGTEVAEARLAQATVVSPVTGVVTEARRAGTVAMAGAPLVRVRPDAPARVDTFVTPEQLARVRLGSAATADFDSNAGPPLRGRVTRISERAEFPPASFATGVVHMMRAVRVTITLDSGWAPPGTPADVTVLTDER